MAPHPPSSAEKAALRRAALSRRDALSPEARRAASLAVADTVLALDALVQVTIVGAFWPIRSEIDPRPIAEGLFARGKRVVLPQVTPEGLVFREWRAGEALVPGSFGLSEPHADLPPLDPDALIVPLAAFDRSGQRIGYGRGYYDGAITRLAPVLTIGIAFACQEVDAVPAEPHDRPLDHVVTEDGPVPLARERA